MAPSVLRNVMCFNPHSNPVAEEVILLLYRKQRLRMPCLSHPVGRWIQSWIFRSRIQVLSWPWGWSPGWVGLCDPSPNLPVPPVLTWNLPISELALIAEAFCTCRGRARKSSVHTAQSPPRPGPELQGHIPVADSAHPHRFLLVLRETVWGSGF